MSLITGKVQVWKYISLQNNEAQLALIILQDSVVSLFSTLLGSTSQAGSRWEAGKLAASNTRSIFSELINASGKRGSIPPRPLLGLLSGSLTKQVKEVH